MDLTILGIARGPGGYFLLVRIDATLASPGNILSWLLSERLAELPISTIPLR